MTNDVFKKALGITSEIKAHNNMIQIISGLRSHAATGRKYTLGISGIAGGIEIPEEIGEEIVKAVFTYHDNKIGELEREFESL